MSLVTHLVISYDHDTQKFEFDGDGSREWIRRLFTPETNTWSDEAQEFVAIDKSVETEVLFQLSRLGVYVSVKEASTWQQR